MQWEVEALEPDELQRLVLAAIAPYIDREVLAWQVAREEEQRCLAAFLDGWDAAGGGAPSQRCTGARDLGRVWARVPGAVTRAASAGLSPPCAAAPSRLWGGRG
ncbi:hypothetical protein CP975_00045 [Streptomyces alboniger]|uniref:Uncharacterized protein n=1 Tax=Streptomyces alboniger TaxID=132473 RepID=A0A5J6H811_STRAD|nr:hypothetical protein CP975_00045 [Streptomyces alboniger]